MKKFYMTNAPWRGQLKAWIKNELEEQEIAIQAQERCIWGSTSSKRLLELSKD